MTVECSYIQSRRYICVFVHNYIIQGLSLERLYAHSGVQKLSKTVINGSILNTNFAVERLDKNKHF